MSIRFTSVVICLLVVVASPPSCFASSGGHGAPDAHGGHDAHGADGAHGAAAPAEVEVSEESQSGYRAVKLGEFQVRTSNPGVSRKDNVAFVLHAMVKNEDYPTFERYYRNHKIKVRDQVVTATRLVPIEDYDDPALKQFRRRILLRLRRALPEVPITDVLVSDFALSVEST